MKKIYYLKTCDSCRKILKQIPNLEQFELQDIKSSPITEDQLNELKLRAGDFQSLFSKRAQLYKSRGLKDQVLTEQDYKSLILEHYTFLSRPVILLGSQIFIGNSTKTVELLISELKH